MIYIYRRFRPENSQWLKCHWSQFNSNSNRNSYSSLFFVTLISSLTFLLLHHLCVIDCNLCVCQQINSDNYLSLFYTAGRSLIFHGNSVLVVYKPPEMSQNQSYLYESVCWHRYFSLSLQNMRFCRLSLFLYHCVYLIGFIEELNAFNNLPFWMGLPSALANTWGILTNIIPTTQKGRPNIHPDEERCPFGQASRCHCESILNLQQQKKYASPESWQILQQANQSLPAGGQEIW